MSKFAVIHDLGPLDDSQRRQYLRDASEFFGLDPDLNALDLIWMDNGGMRRLVAYARRGTTDILRDIHQINVLSVTMQTGPGFVSFTAVGKNAKGRQEIAVGAAGTEGLKGDKLGAAVATAQTRATRRLTLQYVGGGLLDESEVSDASTTDINKLNVSLSSIATAPVQPVVAANTEAGKDVTPAPTQVIDAVPAQVNSVALMPNPVPFSGGNVGSLLSPTESVEPVEPAEPVKRKRRKKIDVPFSEEFGTPHVPEIVEAAGIQTEVQSPVVPLAAAVSPNAGIPESPRTLDHIIEELVEEGKNQPTVRSEVMEAAQASREQNRELHKKLDTPTPEQDKAFRARLRVFTEGVLKEGGMTDGVMWRIKKFALNLYPHALGEGGKMNLTVAEWEAMLGSFEKISKESGPKGLVLVINEVAEKA